SQRDSSHNFFSQCEKRFLKFSMPQAAGVARVDLRGPNALIPFAQMEAPNWVTLTDEQLLERRISTLGLKLEGTPLEPLIQELYKELSAKGLVFHPPCHIGDEWFVPIGIPAIFVPFFLVHERLRALERFMMLEVEGETPEWF